MKVFPYNRLWTTRKKLIRIGIGSEHITTPGDFCDLLVAMNPAALKANAKWLKRTAMVLIDSDTFDEDGLKRAGLKNDPIAELYIEDRTIIVAPITTLTHESLKESGLDKKTIEKCKNMFTLGMACYIFSPSPISGVFNIAVAPFFNVNFVSLCIIVLSYSFLKISSM